MKFLILILSFLWVLPAQAVTPPLYGLEIDPGRLLRLKPIFLEAQKKNWTKALAMANGLDQLSQNALKWYYFADEKTNPSFSELQAFVVLHKEWPDYEKIVVKAERALVQEASKTSPATILKWFSHFPPRSMKGKMLLLDTTPDETTKNTMIQAIWSDYDFSKTEEDNFLKKYKAKLSLQSHLNRARHMMDQGKSAALQDMMRFLPADARKLYAVRQAINRENSSIAGLVRAVPRQYSDDPGLLMQCLKWFHKREFHDEAQIILLEYKPLPEYQTDWENIRRIQAREIMKSRRYRAAHDVAMRHSFTDGEKAADMEWFAGWLKLEYLDDPQKALKHFTNVLKIVKTNLSLSRVYYWIGKSYERMGNKKDALPYFRNAAQFGWTFYGQVAAAHIKIAPNMTPIKASPIPDQKTALIKVAHLMSTINEMGIARQFLQAANKTLEVGGQHLTLSYFAKKLNIIENVIRFAREAQNKSPGIALEGYPKLDLVMQMPLVKQGLDPALVHAVILQESRFDEKVIAPDLGYGYMQFMEPTAKRIAKLARVPFNKKKLLEGKYNILLGTTYLTDLLRMFDGCYPFAIPSYNAGEEAVKKWRVDNGDPLVNGGDIINWMESITFVVTRGYIQRVSENLIVYRHLLKSNVPNAQPWWRVWDIKRMG